MESWKWHKLLDGNSERRECSDGKSFEAGPDGASVILYRSPELRTGIEKGPLTNVYYFEIHICAEIKSYINKPCKAIHDFSYLLSSQCTKWFMQKNKLFSIDKKTQMCWRSTEEGEEERMDRRWISRQLVLVVQ